MYYRNDDKAWTVKHKMWKLHLMDKTQPSGYAYSAAPGESFWAYVLSVSHMPGNYMQIQPNPQNGKNIMLGRT